MSPDSIIHLSTRARANLEAIARQDANGRMVRRAQALLWLDQGESVQAVAERLFVTRQMLYQVVERYESRLHLPVIERIQDDDHPGRPATRRGRSKSSGQAVCEKIVCAALDRVCDRVGRVARPAGGMGFSRTTMAAAPRSAAAAEVAPIARSIARRSAP